MNIDGDNLVINWDNLNYKEVKTRLVAHVDSYQDKVHCNTTPKTAARYAQALDDLEFFNTVFKSSVLIEVKVRRLLVNITGEKPADWDTFDCCLARREWVERVRSLNDEKMNAKLGGALVIFDEKIAPFITQRQQVKKRMTAILLEMTGSADVDWQRLNFDTVKWNLENARRQLVQDACNATGTLSLQEVLEQFQTGFAQTNANLRFFEEKFLPTVGKTILAQRRMAEILRRALPDLAGAPAFAF